MDSTLTKKCSLIYLTVFRWDCMRDVHCKGGFRAADRRYKETNWFKACRCADKRCLTSFKLNQFYLFKLNQLN